MDDTSSPLVETRRVHVRYDLSWRELVAAAGPQTIFADVIVKQLTALPESEPRPQEEDVALVSFFASISTDTALHWGAPLGWTPAGIRTLLSLAVEGTDRFVDGEMLTSATVIDSPGRAPELVYVFFLPDSRNVGTVRFVDEGSGGEDITALRWNAHDTTFVYVRAAGGD